MTVTGAAGTSGVSYVGSTPQTESAYDVVRETRTSLAQAHEVLSGILGKSVGEEATSTTLPSLTGLAFDARSIGRDVLQLAIDIRERLGGSI